MNNKYKKYIDFFSQHKSLYFTKVTSETGSIFALILRKLLRENILKNYTIVKCFIKTLMKAVFQSNYYFKSYLLLNLIKIFQ